jgi:hypothetical protein
LFFPYIEDGGIKVCDSNDAVGWKSAARSTIGALRGAVDGSSAAWWITPLRG